MQNFPQNPIFHSEKWLELKKMVCTYNKNRKFKENSIFMKKMGQKCFRSQIGSNFILGLQSTILLEAFATGIKRKKGVFFWYSKFKKNVHFPIFRLSTNFPNFSDGGIVFSGKFYVEYMFWNIFQTFFFVFLDIKRREGKKNRKKIEKLNGA